jgi:GR25 family glycosyltransferase involved in LPS biosynthesis
MYFNQVFGTPILINLESRRDRLEAFDTQAQALGINYQRLNAIRATDPILGCKLSHMAALSMAEGPVAFVFEDDSAFVDNFYEQLGESLDALPEDWDMVYLGAHILQTQKVNNRWRRSIECSSTHAYAVRKEVIPRLLEAAMTHKGHVDVAYSTLHKEIKAYIARPTLVYQSAGYSDLQKLDVDYNYLYF